MFAGCREADKEGAGIEGIGDVKQERDRLEQVHASGHSLNYQLGSVGMNCYVPVKFWMQCSMFGKWQAASVGLLLCCN